MADFEFKVKSVIFEELIGQNKKNAFRVTTISWNGKPEVLDFRNWYRNDENSEWKPGKGAGIATAHQEKIAAALMVKANL